jgi:hypothetical protein
MNIPESRIGAAGYGRAGIVEDPDASGIFEYEGPVRGAEFPIVRTQRHYLDGLRRSHGCEDKTNRDCD